MKKILQLTSIGLSVGFICTTICLSVFNGLDSMAGEFLIWLLASALYGLSSAIYCVDGFNFLTASALHFGFCFVITAAATFFIGYWSSLSDAVPVLMVFLLLYIVIYFIFYLYSIYDTKQINQKLKSR